MLLFHRLPPKYRISLEVGDVITAETNSRLRSASQNIPTSASPFPARLISNYRVTEANHFQDVRLIRLDIGGANIK